MGEAIRDAELNAGQDFFLSHVTVRDKPLRGATLYVRCVGPAHTCCAQGAGLGGRAGEE